jgi:thiosulfate reductase cytochrome b subunit
MHPNDPAVPATRITPTPDGHPAWVRVTHGINAVAVLLLIGSGWQIYNAAPLFPFTFPREMTLGGWLAGGIQWHFAAMWLLAANGLVYVVGNLVGGRFRRFLPLSPRAALADLRAAVRGRLRHGDDSGYNAIQRLAYVGVVVVLVLLVASGLVLWKPVQFGLLRELLGDYEAARRVHFVAMALLVAFIVVHLAMVALVPRSLRAMVAGRRRSAR